MQNPSQLPFWKTWRLNWQRSLRMRLLVMGLTPLIIAFPLVMVVVVAVGGESADNLLKANLRGSLTGASTYLDQLKNEAGVRVGQLVKSERIDQQLRARVRRADLDRTLATLARSSGLDFLIIARTDRFVLGASTPITEGARLPDLHTIRQAAIGMTNTGYELLDAQDLRSLSAEFPSMATVDIAPSLNKGELISETRGLVITAAAHFPLDDVDTDAILVGGILLNRNFSLAEHMRQIIFPVGMLAQNNDGMTAIHTDLASIAISRDRQLGERHVGQRPPDAVRTQVFTEGDAWLGKVPIFGETFLAGYDPITNGAGTVIGMISVGFPYAPYLRSFLVLVGTIAALLAFTMLGLSVVFLRAGRELSQGLSQISATMVRLRKGDTQARVGAPKREDELGQLAHDFDALIDAAAAQDELRRQAQQAIADEATRRRVLFEHERDGVVILNQDGTVFESNPKAAEMLGYSAEELRKGTLEQWETGPDHLRPSHNLDSVGEGGLFLETWHQRKDGRVYPAEVSMSKARWAEQTFILMLMRDITLRKEVETELERHRVGLERLVEMRTKELQDRSEQLDTIFALSPDGFVSFDQQRQVAFTNYAFLRMTGLNREQVLGLDEVAFVDLLARQCLPTVRLTSIEALRTAQILGAADASKRRLIELSGPGGRVLEVGLRVAEQASISQVLYFRDVTHEMEVDRMKSEFLSTAAHELRTPMASIYGYAEVLLMQEMDRSTQSEFLGTIYRQASLMASIINELLDLARIEARRGKDFILEKLPVETIVRDALASYKPPEGRTPPTLTVGTYGLAVQADRNKMQQAMLNVLSNAYKYSPQGGDVTVTIQSAELNRQTHVRVDVADRGIGMTPAQLARVFERFFRADTSGKIPGTGLGMSIVKEIVELHGGRVTLESMPGRGTTVSLWLPLP